MCDCLPLLNVARLPRLVMIQPALEKRNFSNQLPQSVGEPEPENKGNKNIASLGNMTVSQI